MPTPAVAETEAASPRALNFSELRSNVEGGVWDQVRLAARFFISKVAGVAHEMLIDLPRAVWQEDDPVSYQLAKTGRETTRLKEVGAWAVEQKMVEPGAEAPLPRYKPPF